MYTRLAYIIILYYIELEAFETSGVDTTQRGSVPVDCRPHISSGGEYKTKL